MKLWKNNLSIKDIAKQLGYSQVWIRNILKDLHKSGKITYNIRENKRLHSAKKVLDTETGIEYPTLSGCAKALNMYSRNILKSDRFIIYKYNKENNQYDRI